MDEQTYALTVVEEQHRQFFKYTGWLMVGGGAVLVLVGLAFMRSSNRIAYG